MKQILLLLTLLSPLFSEKERYYQEKHCKHTIEYVLPDRTRVDCLEPKYATEYDFAHKWAECIGQALYYSIKTNRKPKCVLIMRSDEERYLKRLKTVADEYDIKIEIIKR